MQASRIGLWHLEHATIAISARLKSGLGWTDGMMLALDRAGAQRSQSPVDADKGGDGTSMRLPGSGSLVNIAHFPKTTGEDARAPSLSNGQQQELDCFVRLAPRNGDFTPHCPHPDASRGSAASRLKLHHTMRDFAGTIWGNEPYLF